MKKVWTTPGGVHPPENKAQTSDKPIVTTPMPSEFIVPLNQHIGSPALLIVKTGDTVLKGQKIAEAQGYVSVAVHAPSSGIVSAIEPRPMNHPSGQEVLCAVIEPDGKDTWVARQCVSDWRSRDKSELVALIREAGIAGMGGAGFPTAVKVSPKADQKIDTLILNGTECEPYITADDVLMREKADEIISGLEILSYLLDNPRHILIGVEDNKPEAAEAMKRATTQSALDIDVITFPTKYPSGGEKQLIQILTGKEVPSGKIPAELGIVLQNVGTARAVYRAIELGEPLIERITTVVGQALNIQQNINALIGSPIRHILNQHGFEHKHCERVIIGGPMMGYAISDLDVPVVKTTNCILAPSIEEMPAPPPPQACIRCAMCAEACPASLLPQQLYWFSRSENFDALNSHNLFDCIECGACSYVCPSNIPLVQYYRASKGAIRHHDEEKRKAEQSRKRFEFRQERIEKAEREKEAKRKARKKAAEAAKAKLAMDAAQIDTPQSAQKQAPSTSDTHNQASADKTKSKLERALSSAESRAQRALKALDNAKEEGLDTTRIESLGARLKEAEQKVEEAKKKLAAFNNSADTHTAKEDHSLHKIKDKIQKSPEEKIIKTISTLEKRIETAKQKVDEAKNENATSVNALELGVSKLEDKLRAAKAELVSFKQPTQEQESKSDDNKRCQDNTSASKESSAADIAIARAKAKAEAQAIMTPEEKKASQIESLKKRIEKAKNRLQEAEAEQSENLDAFKGSVEKLEVKLANLEASD